MLITSIRYGRKVNLGNYESESLEVEIIPGTGENADDALQQVRGYVESKLTAPRGAAVEKPADVTTSKPAAKPPKKEPKPKEEPSNGTSAPPKWPKTSAKDIGKWIGTLAKSGEMLYATKLLFGPDSPLVSVNERYPLAEQLHKQYHAKLDTLEPAAKETLEATTKEIDAMWTKIDLEKQGTERFSP